MSSSANEARFDQLAATWDENPVIIKMTRAVALKIMDTVNLRKDMNALEFGCGTGLVTVQIAPELGHVTAVDGSDKMLEELGKKIRVTGISNITPMKVDLEKEGLPGNDYDFIYSNMVFHHIDNGDTLLSALFQALAPGGILALSDLDSENGSFHGDVPGVFHLGFSRGSIVTALEKAGFRHCTIENAHVVNKKTSSGEMASFPMFLATGRKP